MADERQAGKSPEFTPEDEIDELFARANANPTRVGCPTRDVLIELAHKRRAISDPAYEHLAKCSACYREFRGFQQTTHRTPLRRAAWIAAAAAVIIVVAGAAWFLSPSRGERGTLPEPSVPESQVAERRMEVDLRLFGDSPGNRRRRRFRSSRSRGGILGDRGHGRKTEEQHCRPQ